MSCQRHANSLCPLATRPQSGLKRWPASQPASHRRRPLEVAIFIVDGTNKYQWTEHALTNPLVCRPCSEVACGLYRSLACVMAWAHRKVELSKLEKKGVCIFLIDSLSASDRGPWPIGLSIGLSIAYCGVNNQACTCPSISWAGVSCRASRAPSNPWAACPPGAAPWAPAVVAAALEASLKA